MNDFFASVDSRKLRYVKKIRDFSVFCCVVAYKRIQVAKIPVDLRILMSQKNLRFFSCPPLCLGVIF